MLARLMNLSLGIKIPALVVCTAAIVALGLSFTAYRSAANLAERDIVERMHAVSAAQSVRVEDYLASIQADLHILAHDPALIDATKAFDRAWDALTLDGGDPTALLQAAYIENNPNPTGQKDELDRATAPNAYNELHGKYHPWLRKLLRDRGYYDIFIFDTDGNLVYTVFKELDYATNLNTGEWRDTDLGNAFRAALDSGEANSTSFFDFKPYAPSYDAPASFISTPIIENSRTIGVLVYQMPIDRINAVMDVANALGEAGEAIIVGSDKLLRNDSAHTEANDILATSFDHAAVDQALNGEVGHGIDDSYRGEAMDLFATPLEFAGTKFAVIALMSDAEVHAPIVALRNMSIWITLIALIMTAAVALLFSRTITRPLARLSDGMKLLADGETNVEFADADRSDEIGEMTRAVAVFRDNAIERVRLEGTQKEEMVARLAREEKVRTLIADFESSIGDVVSGIDGAASQMSETATTLAGVADNTRGRTASVASASTEASTNVQTVASSAEELSASISEIGQQVTRAADVVAQGSARAAKTNTDVAELANAAQRIGEVVTMIRDIAEQTNLLALNATIEAARAGDAGKGFAVVASEVKALATQTAKATEEIGQQIEGIQGSTDGAVDAIGEIARIMEEVNSITGSIAAAVEEQSSATQEISRSIQEASAGTEDVARNVEGIAGAVDETAQSAGYVQNAASDLTDRAVALRAQVGDFLKAVAAA